MSAKLTGRLDSTGADHAVGYLVYCPSRTLLALGAVGATVSLLVDTHVREDHIHLFGFASEAERAWFRLLGTVQGVGTRVALALLSAAGPETLHLAIAAGDRAPLTRAEGVGPKLATRILAELKDKAGALAPDPVAARGAAGGGNAAGGEAGGEASRAAIADAVSALVNLGYGKAEALGAVSRAEARHDDELGAPADVGALIKAGLKELSQ